MESEAKRELCRVAYAVSTRLDPVGASTLLAAKARHLGASSTDLLSMVATLRAQADLPGCRKDYAAKVAKACGVLQGAAEMLRDLMESGRKYGIEILAHETPRGGASSWVFYLGALVDDGRVAFVHNVLFDSVAEAESLRDRVVAKWGRETFGDVFVGNRSWTALALNETTATSSRSVWPEVVKRIGGGS